MKTNEMKFNVIELLGNAHTKLMHAYMNELIDYDSFNEISDMIIQAQKKFRHNFEYDKLNEILTIKNRKEVYNETDK